MTLMYRLQPARFQIDVRDGRDAKEEIKTCGAGASSQVVSIAECPEPAAWDGAGQPKNTDKRACVRLLLGRLAAH